MKKSKLVEVIAYKGRDDYYYTDTCDGLVSRVVTCAGAVKALLGFKPEKIMVKLSRQPFDGGDVATTERDNYKNLMIRLAPKIEHIMIEHRVASNDGFVDGLVYLWDHVMNVINLRERAGQKFYWSIDEYDDKEEL